jgi:hypothetical protein
MHVCTYVFLYLCVLIHFVCRILSLSSMFVNMYQSFTYSSDSSITILPAGVASISTSKKTVCSREDGKEQGVEEEQRQGVEENEGIESKKPGNIHQVRAGRLERQAHFMWRQHSQSICTNIECNVFAGHSFHLLLPPSLRPRDPNTTPIHFNFFPFFWTRSRS